MLWMVSAIALANGAPADPPQTRALPALQAQATVRIVRPALVRLGAEMASTEESVLRSATITDSDGAVRPASLIEFY